MGDVEQQGVDAGERLMKEVHIFVRPRWINESVNSSSCVRITMEWEFIVNCFFYSHDGT